MKIAPTSYAMTAALEAFQNVSKKGTGIHSHMTELNGFIGDVPHRDIVRAVSEHDLLVEALRDARETLISFYDAGDYGALPAHIRKKIIAYDLALGLTTPEDMAKANGTAA